VPSNGCPMILSHLPAPTSDDSCKCDILANKNPPTTKNILGFEYLLCQTSPNNPSNTLHRPTQSDASVSDVVSHALDFLPFVFKVPYCRAIPDLPNPQSNLSCPRRDTNISVARFPCNMCCDTVTGQRSLTLPLSMGQVSVV